MKSLILCLSLVFITNCDTGVSPQDAPSPSCIEADNHSDIEWIEDNVFGKSCSNFSSCHQGSAQDAGGLNLEAGQSAQNLIDVDSDLFPQYKLVAPGDPDNSYLMIILGHVQGPIEASVGTMPYNSPLLCEQKRNAVKRWITGLP